jgi:hypothetical protein
MSGKMTETAIKSMLTTLDIVESRLGALRQENDDLGAGETDTRDVDRQLRCARDGMRVAYDKMAEVLVRTRCALLDVANGATVTIDPDVIRATLDYFDEGHAVHSPEGLMAAGYPVDFIRPLAQTFLDDPDERRTLVGPDGQRLEHLRGVHDLDILPALAGHVGADLSDPDLRKVGRGRVARAYVRCIRRALESAGGPGALAGKGDA